MPSAADTHRVAGARTFCATEREPDVAKAQRWRGRAGKTRVNERLLGGGNGPIWKKRGTIGVPAPTGQGVAAAAQAPQVVAAKGVTDVHTLAEIRPRASCCRVVPQRPAATSHAAWGIRGATVLVTQASFSLAWPAQPASSRRGTILLRTAWIALCPPLRRVARAALPPPFALRPFLPRTRENFDPCERFPIVSPVGWSVTARRWPALRWWSRSCPWRSRGDLNSSVRSTRCSTALIRRWCHTVE